MEWTLEEILEKIKHYGGVSADDDDDDSPDLFWKELFIKSFVAEKSDDKQDDLLFFIYKLNSKLVSKMRNCAEPVPRIDVLRKFSPNLPLHASINWEETLFLNLILQKLEYSVLYSICTRTSRKHYQVLSKQKVKVFATPSSHSVLFKESIEQYSYPLINFYIENFEDFLYENIINELESIYIELVAKDTSSDTNEPFVIFSSCIDYRSVNESYTKENRIICNGQHFGVLQIKDINTEATAEIVVKRKIKRSVSDGSTFSSLMMGPEEEEESADSHLELYLMNLNRRTKFISHLFRNSCYSRRKTKAKCLTIESTDLFADLDDELLTSMWTTASFPQAIFEWKARQKATSCSFHCFLTHVQVPWNHLVNQMLSAKKRSPILHCE